MPIMRDAVTAPCRSIMCGLAEVNIALSRVFDPNRSRATMGNDLADVEHKLRRALTELAEARSALTFE